MNKLLITTIAGAIALTACSNMDPVQRGTAQGAGIGGGLGAVLGAATGGGGGNRTAAGAAIGAAAGAVIGNVWSQRMENQKRAMQQAAQGTGIQVTQTPDNRLKIEIPSDISFDTNRSDIKPNFREVLDKFATTLSENPGTNITIVGHTDSVGSDAYNDQLSMNRAAHTRDYLAVRGVNSSRVNVAGHGEHEPIASNDTDAGRARNRRVEIFVAEQQAAGDRATTQSTGQ
ncbi:MAG: OmpA family protein [Burkholderiales bacterium]|nr:OmpA family protein [Burkholderiales bacterium]